MSLVDAFVGDALGDVVVGVGGRVLHDGLGVSLCAKRFLTT